MEKVENTFECVLNNNIKKLEQEIYEGLVACIKVEQELLEKQKINWKDLGYTSESLSMLYNTSTFTGLGKHKHKCKYSHPKDNGELDFYFTYSNGLDLSEENRELLKQWVELFIHYYNTDYFEFELSSEITADPFKSEMYLLLWDKCYNDDVVEQITGDIVKLSHIKVTDGQLDKKDFGYMMAVIKDKYKLSNVPEVMSYADYLYVLGCISRGMGKSFVRTIKAVRKYYVNAIKYKAEINENGISNRKSIVEDFLPLAIQYINEDVPCVANTYYSVVAPSLEKSYMDTAKDGKGLTAKEFDYVCILLKHRADYNTYFNMPPALVDELLEDEESDPFCFMWAAVNKLCQDLKSCSIYGA